MCQFPRPDMDRRPNVDGTLPLFPGRPASREVLDDLAAYHVKDPPLVEEPEEEPQVPETPPEVVPLPDDFQLVTISLVSEGGHPIQVAPPVPVDQITLTLEVPPAPVEEPKVLVETGPSDQELAVAAIVTEQDRRAFEAMDQPDPPKPTGKGKSKVMCPGPKCRRQARKGSPYCSSICKDRCYRLRKKAFRAVLTDVETSRLNRILTALEAWYGEKGDGGVGEEPVPEGTPPLPEGALPVYD